MKLPVYDTGLWVNDADGKTVFSCAVSDFEESEDVQHRTQTVRAVNHHDALVAALASLIYDCREYSGIIGRYEREHSEFAGAGKRFDEIVEKAAAALAAAKGEADASN